MSGGSAETPLREAAAALVAALDRCKPALDAQGMLAYVHGQRYDGPTFKAEWDALRAAVERVPRQTPSPEPKVLSPERRAANEASFKQSGLDWCAHQMAHNWPRNEFGSLLTEGEVSALRSASSSLVVGGSEHAAAPAPPEEK